MNRKSIASSHRIAPKKWFYFHFVITLMFVSYRIVSYPHISNFYSSQILLFRNFLCLSFSTGSFDRSFYSSFNFNTNTVCAASKSTIPLLLYAHWFLFLGFHFLLCNNLFHQEKLFLLLAQFVIIIHWILLYSQSLYCFDLFITILLYNHHFITNFFFKFLLLLLLFSILLCTFLLENKIIIIKHYSIEIKKNT
jgi:hypothetical protein